MGKSSRAGRKARVRTPHPYTKLGMAYDPSPGGEKGEAGSLGLVGHQPSSCQGQTSGEPSRESDRVGRSGSGILF